MLKLFGNLFGTCSERFRNCVETDFELFGNMFGSLSDVIEPVPFMCPVIRKCKQTVNRVWKTSSDVPTLIK